MGSTYKVVFVKEALKYFEKLDRRAQQRIANVIERLKEDPFAVPHIKPLEGVPYEQYRIRIGDLRLIYRVEHGILLIMILKIGPRGDVYKG